MQVRVVVLLLGVASATQAETASALFSRGFAVIPEPQRITLQKEDFLFDSQWQLALGSGVPSDSSALESLVGELQSRHQLVLGRSRSRKQIVLEMKPNSVEPGPSQTRDREAIRSQAYRLNLAPSEIRITANAPPGLFYGVQTFLQLLKPRDGSLWLPRAEIIDWPDLGLRQMYWDDAHHLERMDDLKRAIRQAAFFKINGFVIKLEGHFEYRSAPALVEPQALAPTELQQLTDYGLRYHVQVIPYLDAPAHIAFILKHPEYAPLRAFPNSNYELCMTNPGSLKLLEGMYGDLLAANKGVKYFYLSTDEAYYAGLADNPQCQEKARETKLGTPGKVLAEFVSSLAGYLHDRGREVIFWGEYPLKPPDIASLPPFIINGETYGPAFDAGYRSHGIRQMIYGSTEGEEHLFPHYFLLPDGRRMHALNETEERVSESIAKIANDPARRSADLIGLIIAGWGDMGLHPETFWLGYTTILASGWKPWTAPGHQVMSTFYPLFYGPGVTRMDRAYQLLSYQAQTWTDSWERIDSTVRPPIWGNSERIFDPPQPAHDQSIPLPDVPSADFRYNGKWSEQNAQRLQLLDQAATENDELKGLLNENLLRVSRNQYGLEVFLSLAALCRQNIEFFDGLRQIDAYLITADSAAQKGSPEQALKAIDQALTEAQNIRNERNTVLHDAIGTWGKSWLPRVPEANGRRFLHSVDDVKDHLPDRTVDMSYLVYRELLLPFDKWYDDVQATRNRYAESHHLRTRDSPLRWTYLD